MYEQGIRMELDGTPLAAGTSAGVHESQSRLWENLVGRSREFLRIFLPTTAGEFPGTLADVSWIILPGSQQGAALAGAGGRRRGDLQPARHDAL